MSTSLLYHAFGIRGYDYVSTSYQGGRVVFTIEQRGSTCRCPVCGSPDVHPRGQRVRRFRAVPIGSKPVVVVLPIPRVECPHCGLTRQVSVDFVAARCSYTRSFERYALELSRMMTIKDVASHLQISWDTIKDIQKRHLRKRFGMPRLNDLTQIAIDEISISKGHRYLTVVLDLETGAVVFVGDGKGADSLQPFWKRLRASGARIEAVATDMSAAYTEAIRQNLSGAVHVFDHFHVIKLFNEKLTELRRQLHREATDKMQKQVLKGTRWLLLKNPENLDAERDEHERLDEALRLNQPLATAYYLKEDLRQIWTQANKANATKVLQDWIQRAQASGIRLLQRFAATLATYRRGILAYYDYAISTGPLEGINNKIKTMKRQAYGFRDREFFKLKIYGLHQTKLALVG